jgi:hypothetical protein
MSTPTKRLQHLAKELDTFYSSRVEEVKSNIKIVDNAIRRIGVQFIGTPDSFTEVVVAANGDPFWVSYTIVARRGAPKPRQCGLWVKIEYNDHLRAVVGEPEYQKFDDLPLSVCVAVAEKLDSFVEAYIAHVEKERADFLK